MIRAKNRGPTVPGCPCWSISRAYMRPRTTAGPLRWADRTAALNERVSVPVRFAAMPTRVRLGAMGLFRRKPVEERAVPPLTDPRFLAHFGLGQPNYSGITVNETGALGIAAVYRAVSLIAQTLASLPSGVIEVDEDGGINPVDTWLDNPGGADGQTAFEFWESTIFHLLLLGNMFAEIRRNAAGGINGLNLLYPASVTIEMLGDGSKLYEVQPLQGEKRTFTDRNLIHIPGPSMDGIRGMSLVSVARQSFGTTAAGERAAANAFAKGAMVGGLVSADGEDVEEGESEEIKELLDRKVAGWENAGEFAFVNRRLKFTPWQQTMADAQFLESRVFQIEEIARWFGVPPFALMSTEKSTSWGTGIESQQRGLSRQVLGPWASRIEHRVSRLIAPQRRWRVDFTGLERPTPVEEIGLIVSQLRAGLITLNEARAMRHLPPIEGGDEVRPPDLSVVANIDDAMLGDTDTEVPNIESEATA